MNTSPKTAPAIAPWPYFDQEQVNAAAKVLESGKVNYWTGQEGRQFEAEFAAKIGSKYAVAMSNGTVTLDACLRALGVGPGDDVLVTPRTFLASASTVISIGGNPVFADVDPVSGCVTAETLAAAATPNTKAAIPVHLGGWICDMPAIMAWAQPLGIKVIEDCAQVHGGTLNGQAAGTFGEIASWSFCQDKIMTTGGEGGMVTTDDPDLWRAVWSLKDHGKNYDTVYRKDHPPGFRWVHESFGTNWRMTEMQSAIGRVQVRRLDDWVAERRANAAFYMESLNSIDCLTFPEPPEGMHHPYYKLYFLIDPAHLRAGVGLQDLLQECGDRGVQLFTGTCSEVYLEKCFTEAGIGPAERLPNAKLLGETSLMLPVHPGLTDEYLEASAEIIKDVLRRAVK
jgi:dTDP-4-amino-4,6-dideoxygalactose transaminase